MSLVGRQFGRPGGLVGRLVGRGMGRTNAHFNKWLVNELEGLGLPDATRIASWDRDRLTRPV